MVSNFPSASYVFCCRTLMLMMSLTLNFRGGTDGIAIRLVLSIALVCGLTACPGGMAANPFALAPTSIGWASEKTERSTSRCAGSRISEELCAAAVEHVARTIASIASPFIAGAPLRLARPPPRGRPSPPPSAGRSPPP